jgi:hypothetical protein
MLRNITSAVPVKRRQQVCYLSAEPGSGSADRLRMLS